MAAQGAEPKANRSSEGRVRGAEESSCFRSFRVMAFLLEEILVEIRGVFSHPWGYFSEGALQPLSDFWVTSWSWHTWNVLHYRALGKSVPARRISKDPEGPVYL